MAAHDIAQLLRCRQGTGTLFSGAECDLGIPPQQAQYYKACYGSGGANCFYGGTLQAACDSAHGPYLAWYNAASAPNYTITGNVTSPCVHYATVRNSQTQAIVVQGFEAFATATGPVTVESCGPLANGVLPVPGIDGKCDSGVYTPQSEQQVGQRVTTYINPDNNPGWPTNVVEKAMDNGVDIAPYAGPTSVTGPASQTGSPTTTTTTNPNGTTKTVTETPTYSYTYQGNSYSWTTSNTTISNDNGSVTTTVTNPPAATPQDDQDPCRFDPSRAGCTPLGDPPTDAPTWQTQVVPFNPQDLGLPAACPAPRIIQGLPRLSIDYTLSYQAACDVAPVVRLGVLALTALACATWILTVIRS
jgi:hypothetical protein